MLVYLCAAHIKGECCGSVLSLQPPQSTSQATASSHPFSVDIYPCMPDNQHWGMKGPSEGRTSYFKRIFNGPLQASTDGTAKSSEANNMRQTGFNPPTSKEGRTSCGCMKNRTLANVTPQHFCWKGTTMGDEFRFKGSFYSI